MEPRVPRVRHGEIMPLVRPREPDLEIGWRRCGAAGTLTGYDHGAIGATLLAIAVLGAVLQLAMLWAFHRLARP